MTQDQALAILESGHSCLLTGAAGTGKTFVLRQFIRRAKENGKTVSVKATTGLAATHLNGNTIHAWAGIGIHDELPVDHLYHISKTRTDILRKTDILVIDEISLLHDFRFDMIDHVLQFVRQNDKPFGGVQIVLSGDFFQLPPINRYDARQGGFVTTSEAWANCDFIVCYLDRQYRQHDSNYSQILNGIRAGHLAQSQLDALSSRNAELDDPHTKRTRLLTTNADVDTINQFHLEQLNGELHTYDMTTTGKNNYVEQLKRSCIAINPLRLKKNAFVMCIKNSTDRLYVNGSLGIVVDFEKDTNYPIVRLQSGKLVTIRPDSWELTDGDRRLASLTQIPLRLAWAITVHKSQGMTLDNARIDLRRAFVEGMGYVALSRVPALNNLILDGFNAMALRVSPLAKEIDNELKRRSQQALLDYQPDITNWQKAQKNRKLKNVSKNKNTWVEKIEKMREKHPNAYRPWTIEDDAKLKTMYKKEISINQLSKIFGRHEGSITKRLEKLQGEKIISV